MSVESIIKPVHPSAALVPVGVSDNAGLVALTRPFLLIGSRNRAHVRLVSDLVSRNHACVVQSDGRHYVCDLASRSGIVVNGSHVRDADLQDGDTIEFGPFKFKYTADTRHEDLEPPAKAVDAVLSLEGGELISLNARVVLIGRRVNAEVPLSDRAVSNGHAVIFRADGRHYIRDLDSRTGTFVNGTAVRRQPLELGDEIRIGGTVFRYLAAATAQAEAPLELSDPDEPIGLYFDSPIPIAADDEQNRQERLSGSGA